MRLVQMKNLHRMVLEEPYRIFFPLGILAGIYGVMMWPMLYAGWLRFYPGEAHTRMMVEGFIGAFVLGFIGTAFPRLTGNRHWFSGEFFLLMLMWILTVVSHAINHTSAGDSIFGMMMFSLFISMAGRWVFGRKDIPPPGFALALTGILGAAVAAGFLAWSKPTMPHAWQFARLWLFQGFLLLPVMGVGPYLIPRFFGMASTHAFDDSITLPAGWWKKAVLSISAGLLIVVSFLLEVYGKPMSAYLLRAGVIVVWFSMETPVFRRAKLSTTPGNTIRWSMIGMAAGCLCAAFWPLARVGSLHLFFVSGIGLLTLAVGVRVILGHAGRHDLLTGKIVWLRWVAALIILAAITRMSCDFLPTLRVSHQIYAAYTWALAALIWLSVLAKHLLRNEDSIRPKFNCPLRGGKRKS
ncbi:MAG: NnrS family protein [Gloeobacteraceae cyanobacterium ES-bin-144]|nr:NnrS family protein [Verrucomicrobiales bacterium]